MNTEVEPRTLVLIVERSSKQKLTCPTVLFIICYGPMYEVIETSVADVINILYRFLISFSLMTPFKFTSS